MRKRLIDLLKQVFPDSFFVKLENRAEFFDGDVVVAVFAIRLPHFPGHALSGTILHPGDIHDIPVCYNHPTRHFGYRHDYRQIDA